MGVEALLLFAAGGDTESYVFALTKEVFDWKAIPLGGEALAHKVTDFRRGLDVDMLQDQQILDKIKKKRELFNLGTAHELYTTLISPVEPMIRSKRHLLVVPFGPLTAVPFHLLITEKAQTSAPAVKDALAVEDMEPYRVSFGRVIAVVAQVKKVWIYR